MYTLFRIVQLLAVSSIVLQTEAFVVHKLDQKVDRPRIADIRCQEYSEVAKLTNTYCSLEHKDSLQFPHHAVLGYREQRNGMRFTCGGTLISERFVLTAAHCTRVSDSRPPDVVRLAVIDRDDALNCDQDYGIEEIKEHPKYKSGSFYNDIALVKLNESVVFTFNYRPACLWTSMDLNFTSVIATGFGVTENGGDQSRVLNMVELEVLHNDACNKDFRESRKLRNGIINEQICIGKQITGFDTCTGDSGGPVQVILQKKGCLAHIVGVTSVGSRGCGMGDITAAVYTRVASYIDWIEEVVWK